MDGIVLGEATSLGASHDIIGSHGLYDPQYGRVCLGFWIYTKPAKSTYQLPSSSPSSIRRLSGMATHLLGTSLDGASCTGVMLCEC